MRRFFTSLQNHELNIAFLNCQYFDDFLWINKTDNDTYLKQQFDARTRYKNISTDSRLATSRIRIVV